MSLRHLRHANSTDFGFVKLFFLLILVKMLDKRCNFWGKFFAERVRRREVIYKLRSYVSIPSYVSLQNFDFETVLMKRKLSLKEKVKLEPHRKII